MRCLCPPVVVFAPAPLPVVGPAPVFTAWEDVVGASAGVSVSGQETSIDDVERESRKMRRSSG